MVVLPGISAQVLRHISDCLELTGHAPDELLARIGLRRNELHDQDRLVPMQDYLNFFDEASLVSRNPHFGLHAGRLTSSDSLGALSLLFLCAPNLRTAFQSFTLYLDVMQEASRHSFREEGKHAIFEYSVGDDRLTAQRQDSEYSLGTINTLCRQYVGNDFCVAEVLFEHERIGSYTRYQEYFDCEVFFEQGSNYLIFDRNFLDRRTTTLSDGLFPIITAHLDRKLLERSQHDRFSSRLKSILDSFGADRLPSQNDAASMLGISSTTLIRRLKEENSSWRALSLSRRMMAAARLLEESRRPISDIALATGYAEGASFTRAFRSFFGETPKDYRNRKKNQ